MLACRLLLVISLATCACAGPSAEGAPPVLPMKRDLGPMECEPNFHTNLEALRREIGGRGAIRFAEQRRETAAKLTSRRPLAHRAAVPV